MKDEQQGKSGKDKIRRILVAVDLSAYSKALMLFGGTLAEQFGARFTVLHVVEDHMTGSWAADLANVFVSARQDERQNFEAFVTHELPATVKPELLVRSGAPGRIIAEVAKQEDTDLIIVASHGRSGFQHALLGSVTEQVIRSAPCPVLVLPMGNNGALELAASAATEQEKS